METEIFDRETILDLMVNFIPLGIILFFIGTFAVFTPWGVDSMASGLMFAIMIVMFIALGVLTYLSGKAIAGDEKRATVYAQGQAGLEGAEPLHGHDESAGDVDAEAAAAAAEADAEAAAAAAEADAEADAETAESNDDEATTTE